MWPVAAFYDGSNAPADEELLLARVFRERGREDLARYVLDGRKVQRKLLFALAPSRRRTRTRGLLPVFSCGLSGYPPIRGIAAEEEKQGERRQEREMWRAGALVEGEHDVLAAMPKSP